MFRPSISRAVGTRSGRVSSSWMDPLEPRRLLTVLLPGGSVAVAGTTSAARPELAGIVIRDALLPFTITSASGATIFKGTLQDRVVRENQAKTLDFYETIISNTTSPTAVLDAAIRAHFSGFSTDVDFRIDGVGTPAIHPTKVARSGAPGTALKFDFSAVSIAPGQQSRYYFIKTNAVAFDVKGITAIVMRASTTSNSQGVATLQTSEPIAVSARTGVITGIKFNDLNGDGKRQSTEPPLPKWTIFLDTNKNGKLDAGEKSTTTNPLGRYAFANLAPGTYRVAEVLQTGWRQTAPATKFYTATVSAGAVLTGLDFGNTRLAQIGGTVNVVTNSSTAPKPLMGAVVFLDMNNNGLFDKGETMTKTDSKGHYMFNLAEGAYDVSVMAMPGFFIKSPAGGDFVIGVDSGQVMMGLNFLEMHV